MTVNLREECLETARECVTKDRAKSYGDAEDNFSNIAKIWNAQGVRINKRKVTATDVALMMVGMKLARLRYNPEHKDSWIDIAGYAACGMECGCKPEPSKTVSGSGHLFYAPLGTPVDGDGWVQLGYTTEGIDESLFYDRPAETKVTFKLDDVSKENLDIVLGRGIKWGGYQPRHASKD